MPIYHGSTPVGALHFGGTSIGRVYHGSTLVFEKGAGGGASTDPHWSNVKLLAGFESGQLVDESPSARVLASRTGITISSTAAKFGAHSLFTGVNEYAYAADHADWAFGAAPFTLEAWARWSSVNNAATEYLLSQYDTGTGQRSWAFGRNAGSLQMLLSSAGASGTPVASALWAPVAGTWYHVVGEFDGTAYRTYVDGVMMGKSTVTPISLLNSSAEMRLGAASNNGANNGAFAGYLDEVRITKGVARYATDAGFVVPTGPFPRT